MYGYSIIIYTSQREAFERTAQRLRNKDESGLKVNSGSPMMSYIIRFPIMREMVPLEYHEEQMQTFVLGN